MYGINKNTGRRILHVIVEDEHNYPESEWLDCYDKNGNRLMTVTDSEPVTDADFAVICGSDVDGNFCNAKDIELVDEYSGPRKLDSRIS